MAKCRAGFVSNSSSSSFVIAVPKGTDLTVEAFHKAMYNTSENIQFVVEYEWLSQIGVKSVDVVESIIHQINSNNSEPMDEQIKQAIGVEDFDYRQFETIPVPGQSWKNTDWPAYEAAYTIAEQQELDKLLTKFNGQDIYVVEFEDHSTFGCEVEHGPALRGLDNVVRYSHH